jgi:hypothetical protein
MCVDLKNDKLMRLDEVMCLEWFLFAIKVVR